MLRVDYYSLQESLAQEGFNLQQIRRNLSNIDVSTTLQSFTRPLRSALFQVINHLEEIVSLDPNNQQVQIDQSMKNVYKNVFEARNAFHRIYSNQRFRESVDYPEGENTSSLRFIEPFDQFTEQYFELLALMEEALEPNLVGLSKFDFPSIRFLQDISIDNDSFTRQYSNLVLRPLLSSFVSLRPSSDHFDEDIPHLQQLRVIFNRFGLDSLVEGAFDILREEFESPEIQHRAQLIYEQIKLPLTSQTPEVDGFLAQIKQVYSGLGRTELSSQLNDREFYNENICLLLNQESSPFSLRAEIVLTMLALQLMHINHSQIGMEIDPYLLQRAHMLKVNDPNIYGKSKNIIDKRFQHLQRVFKIAEDILYDRNIPPDMKLADCQWANLLGAETVGLAQALARRGFQDWKVLRSSRRSDGENICQRITDRYAGILIKALRSESEEPDPRSLAQQVFDPLINIDSQRNLLAFLLRIKNVTTKTNSIDPIQAAELIFVLARGLKSCDITKNPLITVWLELNQGAKKK